MDWNDLRVFLTAVRAGSYSAAGPQLGLNRTTIGRRVAALEASLQTALFRETPTGPEPTEAGRLLLEAGARVETEIAEVLRRIALAPPDPAPLRIASSAGLVVELMAELGAAAPSGGPAIELVHAIDPVEAVTLRRADLALALIRAVPRRLAGRQAGIVTQARYARRGTPEGPPLCWGEEVELALPRHWTAANSGDDAPGAIRFSSWGALAQAVRSGVGKAWLCCFAADDDPVLERIAPPDPRFDTGLWLLHRADTPQSAAAAALTQRLAERIAVRLGAQAV
ncbi:transcriptional regulator, LysR family [Sphingomonas jatrophae]|uniref:Transcriptional regulator, LysR family n=2 Tax=Sphingomonas jatrophae TaxID=1166337 RepID=A0A1I6KKK7_9SPHN|nr:transcriptional regulator, LysR family [Sphingomonas jatrophae]